MLKTNERPVQAYLLPGAMILLQILWLALTWLSGAATNWRKIPLLLLYSLVAGGAVLALPIAPASGEKTHLLLLVSLVVLAVGVVYARDQRVWPDETLSRQVARIVAREGIGPLWAKYKQSAWLAQQHPPLLIILYGLAMRAFGARLLVARLVTLFLAVMALWVAYFLGREFHDRQTGETAMLFLLSFPLFMRLGTAEMSDVPVMLFFSLALLLILRLLRRPSYRLALLAGLVIVAGLLVKYTMVLIYPLLGGWFLASPAFRRRKRYLAVVLSISAAAGVAWLVFASRIGVLHTQVQTLASFATVVFRTDIGRRFLFEALTTRLPAALGVYNAPVIALGAWRLWRRHSRSDLLVALWIAIVFIVLIVTLPDHRYFMLAFPAVAVLMARGLNSVPAARKVVILSLCYGAGALYLFVDWQRAAHLFLP